MNKQVRLRTHRNLYHIRNGTFRALGKIQAPNMPTVEYKPDGSFHKAVIRLNDMNISPMYVIFDEKKEKNLGGTGGSSCYKCRCTSPLSNP